jgi:phage baseplate assembly protein W
MATVTTNKTNVRSFRDLDLNFNIHPIRKDINIHKNEYAVINSVKNLILTNHYERPFQPELGSNIRRLLFENVDSVMAAQIEREIEETILNFEPRVQVSRVTASAAPDENRYDVELEFFVINNPNPITINFFLERIR